MFSLVEVEQAGRESFDLVGECEVVAYVGCLVLAVGVRIRLEAIRQSIDEGDVVLWLVRGVARDQFEFELELMRSEPSVDWALTVFVEEGRKGEISIRSGSISL